MNKMSKNEILLFLFSSLNWKNVVTHCVCIEAIQFWLTVKHTSFKLNMHQMKLTKTVMICLSSISIRLMSNRVRPQNAKSSWAWDPKALVNSGGTDSTAHWAMSQKAGSKVQLSTQQLLVTVVIRWFCSPVGWEGQIHYIYSISDI